MDRGAAQQRGSSKSSHKDHNYGRKTQTTSYKKILTRMAASAVTSTSSGGVGGTNPVSEMVDMRDITESVRGAGTAIRRRQDGGRGRDGGGVRKRSEDDGEIVPSVRQWEAPLERRLNTDLVLGDRSDPKSMKLSLESMQRIQQLIQAQKNFLRYYEKREKLERRRYQQHRDEQHGSQDNGHHREDNGHHREGHGQHRDDNGHHREGHRHHHDHHGHHHEDHGRHRDDYGHHRIGHHHDDHGHRRHDRHHRDRDDYRREHRIRHHHADLGDRHGGFHRSQHDPSHDVRRRLSEEETSAHKNTPSQPQSSSLDTNSHSAVQIKPLSISSNPPSQPASDPPSQPFQAFHELNLNLENLTSEKSSFSPVKGSSTFSSMSSTLGKEDVAAASDRGRGGGPVVSDRVILSGRDEGSSDKENLSRKQSWNGSKSRKVAKISTSQVSSERVCANLVDPPANTAQGSKRKEPDGATNNSPVKIAKLDKIVGTDDIIVNHVVTDKAVEGNKYQDEATQTSALAGAGSKVVHHHHKNRRRRIVGKIVRPTGNVASSPSKGSSGLHYSEKPWRKNMKATAAKPAAEKPVEEKPPEKRSKSGERPWRVNMKPAGTNIEATVEVVPDKKEVERPWRSNMRPKQPPPKTTPEEEAAKRQQAPAYDREEIRKFMLAKKKREKEEEKKREKESLLRQEKIKQRLQELDKLQKKITETEIVAAKKTLKEEERQRAVASQLTIKEKLLQLTDEMKRQWSAGGLQDLASRVTVQQEETNMATSIRQSPESAGQRHQDQQIRQIVVHNEQSLTVEREVLGRVTDVRQNVGETVLEFREGPHVDNVDVGVLIENKLGQQFSKDNSDVSDATEIKSLPSVSQRSVSRSTGGLAADSEHRSMSLHRYEGANNNNLFHRDESGEKSATRISVEAENVGNSRLTDEAGGSAHPTVEQGGHAPEDVGYIVDQVPERDLSDNSRPLEEGDPHLDVGSIPATVALPPQFHIHDTTAPTDPYLGGTHLNLEADQQLSSLEAATSSRAEDTTSRLSAATPAVNMPTACISSFTAKAPRPTKARSMTDFAAMGAIRPPPSVGTASRGGSVDRTLPDGGGHTDQTSSCILSSKSALELSVPDNLLGTAFADLAAKHFGPRGETADTLDGDGNKSTKNKSRHQKSGRPAEDRTESRGSTTYAEEFSRYGGTSATAGVGQADLDIVNRNKDFLRLDSNASEGRREFEAGGGQPVRELRVSKDPREAEKVLEDYVPKFPQIITRGPRPRVTKSEAVQRLDSGSRESLSSDKPPHWFEVTKDSSETDFNDLVVPKTRQLQPQISGIVPVAGGEARKQDYQHQQAGIPVTNLRNQVLQQNFNEALDMNVSEGPLSPLESSSETSVSGIPKKFNQERMEAVLTARREEDTADQDTDLQEDSLASGRSRMRRRNSRTQQQQQQQQSLLGSRTSRTVSQGSAGGGDQQQPPPDSVPNLMHLRFMTELNQLESMNATEQMLNELKLIKQTAFTSQASLTDMTQKLESEMRHRQMTESQDQVDRAKETMAQMYADKLKELLESQTEATKATSAVAQQLGELHKQAATGRQDSDLVKTLNLLHTTIQDMNTNRIQDMNTNRIQDMNTSRERSGSTTATDPTATGETTSRMAASAATITSHHTTSSMVSEVTTSKSSKPPSSAGSRQSVIRTAGSRSGAVLRKQSQVTVVDRKGSSSSSSVPENLDRTAGEDLPDSVPISSEIIIGTSSRSASSVQEAMSQAQLQGDSIIQTISEAIASISEAEHQHSRTKSSITGDVEEALQSTDYSSHFEEVDDDEGGDSTLREKSFRAPLPPSQTESHQQRRRSEKLSTGGGQKKKSIVNLDSSDASESSLAGSDGGSRLKKKSSSESLFSDSESFTRFTLDMVEHHMREEKSRDKHTEAILKLKEKTLIEKAKKELDALEKLKLSLKGRGEDDKVAKIKKKQEAILHKLKARQKEIAHLRGNLRNAERQRRFLLKQQKTLMRQTLEDGVREATDEAAPGHSQRLEEEGEDSSDGCGGRGAILPPPPPHETSESRPQSRAESLTKLKLDHKDKFLTRREKKLRKRMSSGGGAADQSQDRSTVDDSTISERLDNVSGDYDDDEEEDGGSVRAAARQERAAAGLAVKSRSLPESTTATRATEEHSLATEEVSTTSSRRQSVKRSQSLRYSSNESEGENQNLSLNDTISDQSDIEARILALNEQLQKRMKVSAALKKEQKRNRREKLMSQEKMLLKQIEVYDTLINKNQQDISRDKAEHPDYARPKIKSPRSSFGGGERSLSEERQGGTVGARPASTPSQASAADTSVGGVVSESIDTQIESSYAGGVEQGLAERDPVSSGVAGSFEKPSKQSSSRFERSSDRQDTKRKSKTGGSGEDKADDEDTVASSEILESIPPSSSRIADRDDVGGQDSEAGGETTDPPFSYTSVSSDNLEKLDSEDSSNVVSSSSTVLASPMKGLSPAPPASSDNNLLVVVSEEEVIEEALVDTLSQKTGGEESGVVDDGAGVDMIKKEEPSKENDVLPSKDSVEASIAESFEDFEVSSTKEKSVSRRSSEDKSVNRSLSPTVLIERDEPILVSKKSLEKDYSSKSKSLSKESSKDNESSKEDKTKSQATPGAEKTAEESSEIKESIAEEIPSELSASRESTDQAFGKPPSEDDKSASKESSKDKTAKDEEKVIQETFGVETPREQTSNKQILETEKRDLKDMSHDEKVGDEDHKSPAVRGEEVAKQPEKKLSAESLATFSSEAYEIEEDFTEVTEEEEEDNESTGSREALKGATLEPPSVDQIETVEQKSTEAKSLNEVILSETQEDSITRKFELEVKKTTGIEEDEQDKQNRLNERVERLTAMLFKELLSDSTDKLISSLADKKKEAPVPERPARPKRPPPPQPPPKPPKKQPSSTSSSSPRQAATSGGSSPLTSPRKPQDLMLTTFDISPASSSADDEEALSPVTADQPPMPTHADSSFRPTPDIPALDMAAAASAEGGFEQENFFDDDFGLSDAAIRQKAEMLRLQQLKVEEEIARLQQQEQEQQSAAATAAGGTAVVVRKIPDKPPPPYVPPPVRHFIPGTAEAVAAVVASTVTDLYHAKHGSYRGHGTAGETTADSLLLGAAAKDLNEAETNALIEYHEFLHDIVHRKFQDIHQHEEVEQNPPWMPQKPIWKLKMMIPRSLDTFKEIITTQVLSDLRLKKRVNKESLLVRWSGKKRDRVDDILVRELQEEDEEWKDFSRDEVEVKDQIVEDVVHDLVADTARAFNAVYLKKRRAAVATHTAAVVGK